MPSWPVDVTISVKPDLRLRDPVLVNPLSGEILQIDGKTSGQQWQFHALPLTDYPMLVTDRAIVAAKS